MNYLWILTSAINIVNLNMGECIIYKKIC